MVAKREDLKHRVLSGIESLPEGALAEVVSFVEYQRYKMGQKEPANLSPRQPVALGGLFKAFDLSEEEIDEARREMWCGSGEQGS